jgi:hypothetical protein
MADINLSPLTAEQSALDRRRRMAEAMQQQAILPIDMPNVAGAKVSPYQGLAKLLQGYIAGKGLERADTQQKELEANTMSDFAKVFGLMGKTETVPGKEITPAVPSVAIPENVARQAELARLNQPEAGFEAQANIGKTLMRPQDVQQIQNLPTSTVAVPAEMSAAQQVPALKASMLNDPKFTQTSAGKMMLAQALMQQRAQEQAEALRKREAERAIVKFGPEDTAGTIVNGVFKPIVQGVKQPKWEKSSQYDANGREITGWVNTNAPNIPASFVKGAVKPEMTKAQQLELAIKLFGTRVDAQKAIDEGRVPLTFDPAELDIKPLPPQGTALQTGVVYDTPKGRFRWNGAKFISVD